MAGMSDCLCEVPVATNALLTSAGGPPSSLMWKCHKIIARVIIMQQILNVFNALIPSEVTDYAGNGRQTF